MPVYKCPKCGRTVELPEGTYYCRICGPTAMMIRATVASEMAESGKDEIYDECFREIWKKYMPDERVSEMLKKAGPAFPLPGPHYDYVDLIEHMRYSLLGLCTCNPERLPEYDLLEVYSRRMKLAEKVPELVRAGFIREEDYQYYKKHMDQIISDWEKDFKRYFLRCARKT